MTSHSDHLPSVKPAILRTVTPAPAATQTFPPKRVCQLIVYPPFPRNPLATHVFSPQKVCRETGIAPVGRFKHKTRPRYILKPSFRISPLTPQPFLSPQTSKVYPKTIIPHLFADTSAVSKPTNVQGDGEISVRKNFRQGRLCKFSLIPYSSTI